MAMINQKTGQRQGNANYALYQLYKKNTAGTICTFAASPASTCIFYDTVSGNNSVACAGGTPNCSNATSGQFGVLIDPTKTNTPAFTTTTGYDNATGLGSLNVTNLLNAWSSATFTSDTVTLAGPSGSSPTAASNVQHQCEPDCRDRRRLPRRNSSGRHTGGYRLLSQGDQTFTLSGGAASVKTTELPGGTGVQS